MSDQPINWDKLLRDFRENRCILLLGPRVATLGHNGQAGTAQEQLAGYLAGLLSQEGLPLETGDSCTLPYLAQQYARGKQDLLVDLWDKVADFYQQHLNAVPAVYHRLAALPVSIAVNTAPDNMLVDAWLQENKLPWFRHYNFRRNKALDLRMEQINPQKPLLYNLFGSLQDKESLVLTPADHLVFIRRILEKNPRVPDELVAQFSPFNTYVFLGFDWEDWPLRLLIDALNLCQNTAFSPESGQYPLFPATRSFYEERFHFHFINQDINTFADRIVNGLSSLRSDVPKKVVLVAAPEDWGILQGLEKYLAPLERNAGWTVFHRERVLTGQDTEAEMKRQMVEADAVLLLLSSDFFSNPALLDGDLEWARSKLQMHSEAVIPVIARACDWRADRDLRRITPLPEDSLPIATSPDRDEAYQRIVEQLKRRLT